MSHKVHILIDQLNIRYLEDVKLSYSYLDDLTDVILACLVPLHVLFDYLHLGPLEHSVFVLST